MVSILNAVRDLGRLRQIYVVLVRHGFADLAQRLGFGGGKKPRALLAAARQAGDRPHRSRHGRPPLAEMRDRTVDLMVAAVRQDHIAVADALYALLVIAALVVLANLAGDLLSRFIRR